MFQNLQALGYGIVGFDYDYWEGELAKFYNDIQEDCVLDMHSEMLASGLGEALAEIKRLKND